MSRTWRVVDVSSYEGEIDVRRGRLVVAGQHVPLDDVECLLLGNQSRWSGSLVALAAQFNVVMMVVDWRGIPVAATMPWSTNTRVNVRHRSQAGLSVPRQKSAWQAIVRAKILGQARNLEESAPVSADALKEWSARVRSGDPDNLEARAARAYWSRFFADEDFSRSRDGDGRNPLLNYGYAVLRGFVIRSILITGLCPSLGVWHKHRSNTYALADDLIEPFRPAVDAVVKSLPLDASLDVRETKQALVGAVAQPMGVDGRTVGTAITDLAQAFAMYVEGETDRLKVPTWDPKDG